MRLAPAERSSGLEIMPQQPSVVAAGDQRFPIGQNHAPRRKARVRCIESCRLTADNIDLEDLSIHTCGVETLAIGRCGKAENPRWQHDVARLFQLHASSSLIGSARSSTR